MITAGRRIEPRQNTSSKGTPEETHWYNNNGTETDSAAENEFELKVAELLPGWLGLLEYAGVSRTPVIQIRVTFSQDF